jgi:hypothetical protein
MRILSSARAGGIFGGVVEGDWDLPSEGSATRGGWWSRIARERAASPHTAQRTPRVWLDSCAQVGMEASPGEAQATEHMAERGVRLEASPCAADNFAALGEGRSG